MPIQVTFPMPDDWHVHVRDAELMASVLRFSTYTSRQMLLMPNLVPPLTTEEMVAEYLSRVGIQHLKDWVIAPPTRFYAALFLHRTTSARDIRNAAINPMIISGKFYPDGGTTNSSSQLTSPRDLRLEVLEAMEEVGMVLCLHGEVVEAEEPDPLLREVAFIKYLDWLVTNFPKLKIVVEHVSDRRMVHHVLNLPETVAMTITSHHPFLTHTDALNDPHCNCMPVAKTETDRECLASTVLTAAWTPKIISGTDTAPHPVPDKKAGKAGVWSAGVHASVLWDHFATSGGDDKFEAFVAFTSGNGARFYGLEMSPEMRGEITFVRQRWQVPEIYEGIVPWKAGEILDWRVKGMEWFGITA